MFGLCMGVGQALLAGSSVLPFGDETIHLRKIFALQGWLAEADSTVEKFRLMALPKRSVLFLPAFLER
jgi:hypothetical protein